MVWRQENGKTRRHWYWCNSVTVASLPRHYKGITNIDIATYLEYCRVAYLIDFSLTSKRPGILVSALYE